MAIDTAAKRSSAVHVGAAWRGQVPFPDGTIDQGDRQAVALLYSGILAGEPVAIDIDDRSGTGAASRNATGTGAASRNATGTGRAPNA
jgi:hypothetical protein